MLHIRRLFKTCKLEHLEQLFKVKILLIRHDVKAFIKIIRLCSVISRRQITGGVKRRSVALYQKARGHIVGVEIYHLGAVADFKQSLFVKHIEHRLHFVVVKTLAVIAVELNFKTVVNL